MPRLLILLTLPPQVREQYRARLAARFPEVTIDMVDHYSKAGPYMGSADALVTFGPMMKDEVLRGADKLRWVQALGTGVDNLIDLPSLRPDVIITNIRGIHGAPVSEAAIMMMLALSRDFATSVRNQDRQAWIALAVAIAGRQDGRDFRGGTDRRGPGAPLQGHGDDGGRLHLGQAGAAGLRSHARARRAGRRRPAASIIWCCWRPLRRTSATWSVPGCSPP